MPRLWVQPLVRAHTRINQWMYKSKWNNKLMFLSLSSQSINKLGGPWLVWLSGWVLACKSKGCQFDSQSRAHAWVVGLVPSRGCARGNHTLMFLSLSPFPSLKNKIFKGGKKNTKDKAPPVWGRGSANMGVLPEGVTLSWFRRDHFWLGFRGLFCTPFSSSWVYLYKRKKILSLAAFASRARQSAAEAVSPKSTLLEKAKSCVSFSWVSMRWIQCRTRV